MTSRLDRGVGTSRFYPYDDDLKLLESFREPTLARKLICIKHNDPGVKGLELFSSVLDKQAWRVMGYILGHSSCIVDLAMQSCRQVDLGGLCSGLKINTCIERLWLDDIDLGSSKKMSEIAPFLINNPSLKELVLIGCGLGQSSTDILADVLLSRKTDSLESINVIYNHWSNVDLDYFSLALNKCKKLKSLGLSFNGIGHKGTSSLATLLSNPESNLEHLYLGHNSIGDECIITLAHALLKNTKLNCLGLDGNNTISNKGWSAMLKLVYNNLSVKDVLDSNHTLCDLKCLARDIKAAERGFGVARLNHLRAALKMNRDPNKVRVARRKILWSYAQGDISMDDLPILSGTLPRILSLIGDISENMNANFIQYHHPLLVKAESDTARLNMMYTILRFSGLLYEV